ncbi:unnamed protein product [Calicophoron daubneyi]
MGGFSDIVVFLVTLFFIQRLHLIGASETLFNSIREPINTSVILSCGTENHKGNFIYSWLANEEVLKEIPGYRRVLSNGSLSLRIRMDDADIVYMCLVSYLSPNGTKILNSTCFYGIIPIVRAFLSERVVNTTVDWGDYYKFPCVFGGSAPREDIMILNNQVVNTSKHNITEDSVVECRVRNMLGTDESKAYITIRPGSKSWAMKYGVPANSYCQPYSLALNDSSACSPYLDQLIHTSASSSGAYLVARSRLSSADRTEAAIGRLFRAWDRLLVRRQFNHSVLMDMTNTSRSINSNLSYTAWRCVDWAKRLTCATTYPRCKDRNIDGSVFSPPSQHFQEMPVCGKHCLAIVGLFCLAPLSVSANSSALDELMNYTYDDHYASLQTGWSELLAVPEARDSYLPSPLFHTSSGTPSLDVLLSCVGKDDSLHIASETPCTGLSLEHSVSVPSSFGESSILVEIPPSDPTATDCIFGDGRSYRGTAVMTGCLPWIALQLQRTKLTREDADTDTWPGLFALSTYSFPQSINHETSSGPLCRNPGGIAQGPFCLSPLSAPSIQSAPSSFTETIKGWRITLCENIPLCPAVSDISGENVVSAASDNMKGDPVGGRKLQIIVASSLICLLIGFIVIGYIAWRTSRCGVKSLSDSSSSLSAVEFANLVSADKESPDKGEIKIAVFSSKGRQCSDGTSEQKYLQRRRQILSRRRRLRQLNSAGQCILGSFYRVADCFTCTSVAAEHHDETDAISPASTNAATPEITVFSPARKGEFSILSALWYRIRHCGFLRRVLRTKASKVDLDPKGKNITGSQGRRVEVPLKEPDGDEDEEFEANTLGMKLHKPVAYVAAANLSRTVSTSSTRGQNNNCVNCGISMCANTSVCKACRTCCSENNRATGIEIEQQTGTNLQTDNFSVPLEVDPGLSLTEASVRILHSGSKDLGRPIMPERLFNLASMTHLLHPKLKQVCYPRNRLVEISRLARRAFGWIILAQAPNLISLVRRHRLLSVTRAETLGLSSPPGAGASLDTRESKDDSPVAYGEVPLVVVKMLTDDADLEAQANFLREAEVLVELTHKNIIQLLGVCVPLKPLALLLEYLPFGDLSTFLKRYSQSPMDAETSCNCQPYYNAVNGDVVSETGIKGFNTCSYRKAESGNDASTWVPPAKLTCLDLLEMSLGACDAMRYLSDAYYVHR